MTENHYIIAIFVSVGLNLVLGAFLLIYKQRNEQRKKHLYSIIERQGGLVQRRSTDGETE